MKYTDLPADARPISGFPGYWITPGVAGVEQPRVFSYRRHAAPCYYELRNRFYAEAQAYPRTMLRIDGRNVNVYIHKLVASAFLGPAPDGLLVCHTETDPALLRDPSFYGADGSVRLRYDTHENNIADRLRATTGIYHGPLVKAQALALRAQDPTRSCASVARELGVSKATVYRWVNGRTYAESEAAMARRKARAKAARKYVRFTLPEHGK